MRLPLFFVFFVIATASCFETRLMETIHDDNSTFYTIDCEWLTEQKTKAKKLKSYKRHTHKLSELTKVLDSDFLDMLAIMYCNIYKDAFISIIWPTVETHQYPTVEKILCENEEVIYRKDFTLSRTACKKLLYSIPEKRGYMTHFDRYFPGNKQKYNLRAYLLRSPSEPHIRQTKYKVRRKLGIFPYCIHCTN